MTTVYIAQFEFGKPRLAKAKLIKETEKQYQVKESSNIFNSYYTPARINKDGSYNSQKVFFDIEEALGYLGERCAEHVAQLNKEITVIQEWQVKMLSLLTEMKNDLAHS